MPPELIAQTPMKNRSESKLLVYQNGAITDTYFNNIVDFLQEEDVLVFNDVKVIKAKLVAKIVRSNSGVEFNLDQEILEGEYLSNEYRYWRAICKGSKKLKIDDEIIINDGFNAKIDKILPEGFCILRFNKRNFDENLEKYGQIPLPPYIKREGEPGKEDQENYQTIYAKSGSGVAAPTAGLHFNEEVFEKLKTKNIKQLFVTLNVGAGTFLPVRNDDISKHKMHEESFEISQNVCDELNRAKQNNKRIIAVGTTSLRVLESAIDENGKFCVKKAKTDIFIYPGYEVKSIDGIITNFHLPKSTLFMLVCALIGKENAYNVYNHGIKNKYRFFSYGDSSFLDFSKC